MPFIQVHNASKGYGTAAARTEVLQGIQLSLEEGEFVAIVGYSGTGKSTLINMLSGLGLPDAGTVLMDGQPIQGPGPDRGLVFQNYSLLPWLTVEENISLAVDEVFASWTQQKREEHVKHYITMVKLSHAAQRRPHELSGGMRQRVSLARTLAIQPRVLLLDEPLSALDALTRATLQNEIADICQTQKTTVLWITNDPDEALLVADRVIPLLPTRPATLGASIDVDLERPRDRRTILTHPRFKELRAQLVNGLLEANALSNTDSEVTAKKPDILPEDLSRVNTVQFFDRRGPRRRSDAAAAATSDI